VAGGFTKLLGGLRSFRGAQLFGTEKQQGCYERTGHQAETLLHRRPFKCWWAPKDTAHLPGRRAVLSRKAVLPAPSAATAGLLASPPSKKSVSNGPVPQGIR